MMVSGEPNSACKTALPDYGDPVAIELLANFPIVRDLVVELDGFMHKIESLKPWIIRAKEAAEDKAGRHLEKDTFSQSAENSATSNDSARVSIACFVIRLVPSSRTSPSSSARQRSPSAIDTTSIVATREPKSAARSFVERERSSAVPMPLCQ